MLNYWKSVTTEKFENLRKNGCTAVHCSKSLDEVSNWTIPLKEDKHNANWTTPTVYEIIPYTDKIVEREQPHLSSLDF